MTRFLKTKYLFLFVPMFSLCLPRIVQAQYQNPVSPQVKAPLAKLLESTSMSKLVFEDGREAHLVAQIKQPIPIKVHFQIIENSCFPELPLPQCQWTIEAFNLKTAWIWTKHSDSSKINKTLKVKNTQNSTTQEKILEDSNVNITMSSFFSATRPDLIKHYILKCNNYEWLEKLSKTEDMSGFYIPSWSAEQMQTNILTKKNENMSFGQLDSSILKPLMDNQFKLFIHQKLENDLFAGIIPVIDTQTMYYNHKDKACSLQIKTNGNLGNVTEQLEAQKYIETLYVRLPQKINQNLIFINPIENLKYLVKKVPEGTLIEVE